MKQSSLVIAMMVTIVAVGCERSSSHRTNGGESSGKGLRLSVQNMRDVTAVNPVSGSLSIGTGFDIVVANDREESIEFETIEAQFFADGALMCSTTCFLRRIAQRSMYLCSYAEQPEKKVPTPNSVAGMIRIREGRIGTFNLDTGACAFGELAPSVNRNVTIRFAMSAVRGGRIYGPYSLDLSNVQGQ